MLARDNITLLDTRKMSLPLWVTEDHRKPVTHAHYPKEELLVSALVSNCFCVHITLPLSTSSTDGELKLWSQRSNTCVRTLSGHLNEKNFVGLTVNNHFIAGGKQDCYNSYLFLLSL